mmetsp:Transcript_19695/g.58575  ORF Transcript_19695/g.58575 Transcript_19695/m.58575 type:complete len:244 (+) Transcript_19695:257-988(+)
MNVRRPSAGKPLDDAASTTTRTSLASSSMGFERVRSHFDHFVKKFAKVSSVASASVQGKEVPSSQAAKAIGTVAARRNADAASLGRSRPLFRPPASSTTSRVAFGIFTPQNISEALKQRHIFFGAAIAQWSSGGAGPGSFRDSFLLRVGCRDLDAVISKHRPPGSVISRHPSELQTPFTGNGSPPLLSASRRFKSTNLDTRFFFMPPFSPNIDRNSEILIFSASLCTFFASKYTAGLMWHSTL